MDYTEVVKPLIESVYVINAKDWRMSEGRRKQSSHRKGRKRPERLKDRNLEGTSK